MTNVSNILLLDEEELMREATALLLVNRGANVTKVASIDDALKYLERRTYDVVVVDLQENSLESSALLHRLKAKTSAPTRLIVCTEKPISEADSAGITHVLVKPYPFDRLIEAVFGLRWFSLRSLRPSVKQVARRAATHRRSSVLMRRGRA